MSLSDPIADLLTRIRNATSARHRFVDFRPSKIKLEIVRILQEQGFVGRYFILQKDEERKARLFLKYANGREPILKGLKRKSSPSLRQYVGHLEIPIVRGGMGVAIVSTSKGIRDGKAARKDRLGGELICEIW